MGNQLREERGQAIVILALVMVALLAFVALSIDGGNAYVERRRAQNAADGAALAGARELWLRLSTGDSAEAAIRITINKVAEDNGIADDPGTQPGDFYNSNVVAYYTDRNGNKLGNDGADIEVGTTGSIPPNAAGVQVTTKRSFGTFIAGIINRGQMGAEAQATAVILLPPTCGDYALYASGTSDNPPALKVTGSNGGGDNMTITDGGLYSGGGAQYQNAQVIGNPAPSVDVVGTCTGNCEIGGTSPNYGVTPEPTPELYDLADYQPGGQYAVAAGWTSGCAAPNGCGNYHYIVGNFSASDKALSGLYYVLGDIDLHNVSGNASFVATGDIQLNGTISLSTFDPRFPLFFTTSSNTSVGAVKSSNPSLDLHGFIYAPNGLVKISGAEGQLYGAIYGKEVEWDASKADIYYEPAFCPPTRARVLLLK